MKKLLIAVALTVFLTTAAFADIRLPDKPKPTPTAEKNSKTKTIDSTLVIRLDKNADAAVLRLSKKQLKDLRAQLDEADNASDATAVNAFSRTQTIIGGLFLSCAFVFGGVWFWRAKTGEKTAKTIAAGAILLAFASTATFVFANAGPPAQLRSISGKLFDKKVFGYWNQASGAVKIEVVEGDGRVELIVPDKEEKTNQDE